MMLYDATAVSATVPDKPCTAGCQRLYLVVSSNVSCYGHTVMRFALLFLLSATPLTIHGLHLLSNLNTTGCDNPRMQRQCLLLDIAHTASCLHMWCSEWVEQLKALIFAVEPYLLWAPPEDKIQNVLAHLGP